MLPNVFEILIKHLMPPCVNHFGKNNTRLTLKQRLMLTSEDQTANAREPENNSLKTVESDP